MARNLVQFQKGMSMTEFMATYGSEANCRAALAAVRWPQGFRCPSCHSELFSTHHRDRQTLWQCCRCRHQSSLIAGTIFEASKLPLTKWFLAMFLMTQSKNNISALSLMRHLGVAYNSAWLIKQKLMEVMSEAEETRELSGRVEIDDAYLGGERTGGKVGRGAEGKVPFIAAVQTTEEGHPLYVRLDPVASFSKPKLQAWGDRFLTAETVAISDGLNCFTALASVIARHESVVVGSGKQAAQHPSFHWVNTVIGNLKRALSGTYHSFNFAKYARRYLAEYAYRFNRRFNLRTIMSGLIIDCAKTLSRPLHQIRLAEVGA